MAGPDMSVPIERTRPAAARGLSGWRMLADTFTVGGWTAAVKVLGALKVILAARLFGAGDAMDAYLIAFLAPSFFIDVFGGSLDSALIPSLIEVRQKKGREAAEGLYASALASAGAAVLLAALVTAVLSGWLVPLLATGFAPAKLAFTRHLLLLMIAIAPLNALSSTWRAVLNSEHHFGYAAAVPMVTPLVSIAAILMAGRAYGVEALAAATVAGGALEVLLSGAGAYRMGYPLLPRWSGISMELRQTASQYAPLVAMALVMSGSGVIDQAMAGHLRSGSVAAFSYGTRLLGVLIVIGPTAVGTAVLPHLSTAALVRDSSAARRTLRTYGLAVLGLILPATGVLIYFSEPIVRLLFQQGAFGSEATHLVAAVQRASLLQLPLSVLLAFEIRLTSAWKANRLLYRVAALSLLLTCALDLVFMRWLGVVGIALAGAVTRLVSGLYLSCKIYLLRA
ncbi:MAG TPA: lipid II flippase MurJ [Bryobacteraceae bacterium]|nr:lipid II flippase MurJ [Bryobacteraceae bacterium]